MKKSILTTIAILAIQVLFALPAPCSLLPTPYYNDSSETQHATLEEITVTSTRVSNPGTLSKQEIKSDALQLSNTGVNLPFLLQMTPSLVATSDDGLGIGYTYFRIRGTDHTRINTTINGVPLNDSESQTVFWVNMTDIASSTNSVEIQRGVGTSTNGSAAFGASVNMQTDKASSEPYAQLSFNGGMYNTFREEAKIGTGIMPSGFAFDARISKVNSDGYLERAFSDLLSYYSSASWYGDQTMLKLLFFGGNERTYMAWDGVSAEDLANNRRYNPAGQYIDDNGNIAYYDNQTDNYAQQHAQLHITHKFNTKWDINAALHYTHGAGYYEQYKCDANLADYGIHTDLKSDLVRQKHLGNHFYGAVAAANYHSTQLQASLGGGINNYNGNHWGNVIWLRTPPTLNNSSFLTPHSSFPIEYYRNQGNKLDANIYAKANYLITTGLNLYTDLQYRHINYRINGINDEDLTPINLHKQYHFFNPKAGISYIHQSHTTYFNFAVANREPSRTNFTESGSNNIPLPERLYDYELGYQYLHKRWGIGANFYFMDYYNQLVLTGQYSDVGAYLTKNVSRSYRMGVELTAGVEITKWLRWDVNATFATNKIIDFSDWVDDWSANWDDPVVAKHGGQVLVNYGTTDISFSPNIIAGSNIQFHHAGFEANLLTNYVGRQYLDNTSNPNAMLNNYCVTNLRFAYILNFEQSEKFISVNSVNSVREKNNSSFPIKNISFFILINNLFNTQYESNGGVYSYFNGPDLNGNYLPHNQHHTPWYYPQAGINLHAGFTINF